MDSRNYWHHFASMRKARLRTKLTHEGDGTTIISEKRSQNPDLTTLNPTLPLDFPIHKPINSCHAQVLSVRFSLVLAAESILSDKNGVPSVLSWALYILINTQFHIVDIALPCILQIFPTTFHLTFHKVPQIQQSQN